MPISYEYLDNKIKNARNEYAAIKQHTYAYKRNDKILIKLWNTLIVTVYKNNMYKITPNGHRSKLTKDRINWITGAGIYQRNYQWYHKNGDDFHENVFVFSNGNHFMDVDGIFD